jgi:hypothetical protein
LGGSHMGSRWATAVGLVQEQGLVGEMPLFSMVDAALSAPRWKQITVLDWLFMDLSWNAAIWAVTCCLQRLYLQQCTCTTTGKIARLLDCINAVPSTIAQLKVGACLYLLPRRLQTLFCKVNWGTKPMPSFEKV